MNMATPGPPKFQKIPSVVSYLHKGMYEKFLIVHNRYWDLYKGWMIVGFDKNGKEVRVHEHLCYEYQRVRYVDENRKKANRR
jgi:hypothetical protein